MLVMIAGSADANVASHAGNAMKLLAGTLQSSNQHTTLSRQLKTSPQMRADGRR